MSSLASIVAADGPLKLGVSPGPDVRALQIALSQAGYRVDITPDQSFTADTDYWLRQFQRQHGINVDGVLGDVSANRLDQPHATLVVTAKPLFKAITVNGVAQSAPHDDTASLTAFYGRPWENASLIGHVECPWTLYYEGQKWPHPIPFHVKAAPALMRALAAIWQAAGQQDQSDVLKHVRNYSGSYNYRPIRGSSRLSCHAFAAAIDFDAERLPMGTRFPSSEMPLVVVDALKAEGFYWGGDFHSRPDAEHMQFAHE